MSLSNFKLFGWEKKPITVLRSIKPGDVFCFEVSKGRYCFGRIIAKVSVGHTAEIYDLFLPEPTVSEQQISAAKRIIPPVVLDSYGLFDKKISGEWRIIGSGPEFIPGGVDNFYFVYGAEENRKKVDIFGNTSPVSNAASQDYPAYSPKQDDQIKFMLGA